MVWCLKKSLLAKAALLFEGRGANSANAELEPELCPGWCAVCADWKRFRELINESESRESNFTLDVCSC